MSQNLLTGILIFCSIQAFLFALLFLTKQIRTLSDTIIAIWLVLLGIQSSLICFNIINPKQLPSFIPLALNLLHGPALYLYITKFISEKNKITSTDLLHFSPFILTICLGFFMLKSNHYLLSLSVLSIFSGMLYSFISLSILKAHRQNIANKFSYLEKITLNWIYKLVIGLILIWLGTSILVVLYRFLNLNIPLNWAFIIIPLFITYLGYHGIKQQAINLSEDSQSQTSITQVPEQTVEKNSYTKSGITTEDKKQIMQKLEDAMSSKELFLIPELSLKKLSEELNIPQHHITQTLNEHAGMNFYNFVNSHRIETFKERVQNGDAKNFTILAIALDCGFNSKSSFNRIFKNQTGCSPSEYIRQSLDGSR